VAIAVAIPVAIVVAATVTFLPRVFEFVAALLRLAAVLAVAADLFFKSLFGLVDTLDALVVTVARLRGRGNTKQQETAERRREQRGLPKRYLTQHEHLRGSDGAPGIQVGLLRLVAS
jgi:predicted ABC-type transport system involved in lysophospholipase L1 biosynthesis ATPase subunit